MKRVAARSVCLFFVLSIVLQGAFAQGVRDELAAYNDPPSRLRGVIESFNADVGILGRFYSGRTTEKRIERFSQLYKDELAVLAGLDFDKLNHDEQVDY